MCNAVSKLELGVHTATVLSRSCGSGAEAMRPSPCRRGPRADQVLRGLRALDPYLPGRLAHHWLRSVVGDDERGRFGDGIDEATAEELLRRDVETAERAYACRRR